MLITAVEPRRKAMCALYIDGEYVMNLDARTVIENRFDVGRDIEKGIELAFKAGFKSYYIYENCCPYEITIE